MTDNCQKSCAGHLASIVLPRLPALNGLPDNIRQEFRDIRAPENIVEIRKECAYKFLEKFYLPRVKAGCKLKCSELVSQVKYFKLQWADEYKTSFDDFDLISSIDVKLELLLFDLSLVADLRNLLIKAYDILQNLIENCLDDLLD